MNINDIKIALLDTNRIYRECLSIALEERFNVVDVSDEIIFHNLESDVFLIDPIMRKRDGFQVIEEIRLQYDDAKILICSDFCDDYRVKRSMDLAVNGYVLKSSSLDQLVSAIQSVSDGISYFHPEFVRIMNQNIRIATNILTKSELRVLELMALGYTNAMIAEEFVLSIRTIRTHVSHILNKLEVVNRTQAALYAIKNGLVPLDKLLEFI